LYSNQGLNFSGTLEQLKNYRKVNKTAAVSKTHATEKDLSDREVEFSLATGYSASKQAVSQYQKTLRENQTIEAFYHAYQMMSHPVITLQSYMSLNQAYQALKTTAFTYSL
jgi:hypothetical protein